MKKKIGIVVAIEMDAVKEKYGAPVDTSVVYGYEVLTYEKENCEMFFINSGAGEIASSGAAQVLISDYKVDMILNFGVVGALTEVISTAALCIVEDVVDIDFGSDGWLNLPRGQHPGEDSEMIKLDEKLLDIALGVNPGLVKVRCASTNSFRDEAQDKASIHEKFNADICEMECAGIAYTCKRSKVPFMSLKAVSDSLIGGGKEFFVELNKVSKLCFDVLDQVVDKL